MPRRSLISERDVQRAAREGATSLDARAAVVTPSAVDLAARLGITLERGAASRKPHAAGSSTGERRADLSATGARAPSTDPSARRHPPSQRLPASVAPPAPAPAPGASPGTSPGTSTAPARSPSPFRLAVGADHGGVAMKDALRRFLTELGHDVIDLGTTGTGAVDYPDFAIAVARTVAGGEAELGIMVDGAGIGSCMAANKVAGVRAAMCHDVTTATNAREHNNANVLTLGGALLGQRLAQEIVRTFLETPFAGGRHAGRVGKIDALDAGRLG